MKKNIFPEIKEYTPSSFEDFRGELYTTWKKDEFTSIFGKELEFIHDKTSVSKKHVLRGIHGDLKSWKLMICNYGELYYVVVDNRPDSPTYKQWDWDTLTSKNRKMLLIPPGFGSSFLVMSDLAVVNYKWAYSGTYPDVEDQFTLQWNSPEYNIHWPITNPILSERDA
jgi:dTDP-4-dehydrorhamnose 3,5-epimerase